MQRTLRCWAAAGLAVIGAGLLDVTPIAQPPPDAQRRPVKLADYDEFDLSQLISTTGDNVTGLESILGTTNWLTDPDIPQGISVFLADLATSTANLATNPIALLTETALAVLSAGYGDTAASTAVTAVSDNIHAALGSGDYSAALDDAAKAPTTILYAFLDGYPQAVGPGLPAAPGLLTNTGGRAIELLQQVSNTLADEFATLGGANLTTTPDLVGPGALDVAISIDTPLHDLLPGTLDLTVPAVTGPAVPTFDADLSGDLLAVLGSIAPVPVSADLPTLLTNDPTLDLMPLVNGVLTETGLPVSVVGGDLTANLTGIGAELLALLTGLVP
ncbi:hypothetical protein [Mycobacterium sp.]|uniref:hypothetical protein n=1 Tax=Mycobacterium sp. TaxID=1785 RepID=UPI001273C752|nr:hypothetical protein [Mycobacterium sp.]KAA8970031.1 MAG: hypothetical protein F6Q13_01460 [Mycobacterium sp.]